MKKNRAGHSGFAVFELITLVLLLCVFVCGLVYLTADASGSDAKGKDLSVDVEGEKVLDDLEAILDQTYVVMINTDSGGALDSEKNGPASENSFLAGYDEIFPGEVMVLADLDGDAKTGFVPASLYIGEDSDSGGGANDDERLEVVYMQAEGKTLTAHVLTGESDEPREVVLSEYLDADSKTPFSITCLHKGSEVAADPQKGKGNKVQVDEIRIKVTLEKDGEPKTFEESYRPAEPLPCIVY